MWFFDTGAHGTHQARASLSTTHYYYYYYYYCYYYYYYYLLYIYVLLYFIDFYICSVVVYTLSSYTVGIKFALRSNWR